MSMTSLYRQLVIIPSVTKSKMHEKLSLGCLKMRLAVELALKLLKTIKTKTPQCPQVLASITVYYDHYQKSS